MIISSPEWKNFISIEFVHPIENTKQRREECLANAKLIAAAPELLEALNNVLQILPLSQDTIEIRIKAEEAIRKATK